MSRTVFLGTSSFGASILGHLAGSRHRPALVVAPEDRRRGRGRKRGSPPVAVAAREQGMELLQAEDASDRGGLEAIRAARPDVVCVCAFGQMIREPLLSEFLILNVHPSLLPRWRGAAPIERAIMAGDPRTGVCVMRVTSGLDAGPLCVCEETEIGPGEDHGALESRLAEAGARLLLASLDLHERGELQFAEQAAEGVTYAEKIAPAERQLDPSRSAIELERTVRALNPHIGAYLLLEGNRRLGVTAAVASAGRLEEGELEAADDSLRLGCGEGVLRIEEVRPPGSRMMDVSSFLRGNPAPARAIGP